MKTKTQTLIPLFFFLYLNHIINTSQAQPSTPGITCTLNQTLSPCQTYVFYRAHPPDYVSFTDPPNFLDLATIGDLFNLSRLMISEPSNISSPSLPLIPDQNLFVPISCSCRTVNASTNVSYSYANISYIIKPGDTFYLVSTSHFQSLTTYQAVEVVNPTLVPTDLDIGQEVFFPVFCKCPTETQMRNRVNYMVSYVFQPSDNLSEVASRFGVNTQAIVDVNVNNTQPFDTIFIPVNRLPVLSQPSVNTTSVATVKKERKGLIIGLSIGLGICGILLVLVSLIWIFREDKMKRRVRESDDEKKRLQYYNNGGKGFKEMETSLMADVSECLDKYKVFKIDELIEATDGFNDDFLIQGSVYKGSINGEDYAIKKMKWNAYEELKILQKVNHGNLVRLEGFCIDSEDASCYLIYEYMENGSLHSWLHGNKNEKLNWKTRLRVAIDVANGLQYIHEHTRPRVVHKDIKSSNILLDSTMRAKIANFGLAKSGCNAITMHIVGTQGYIALEYLTDGVVSTKMDVFSFGVVLLELISGNEAIDEEGKVLWAKVGDIWNADEEKKEKRLKGWMDESLLRDTCAMESVMNVMNIAVACVHKDPAKRPSMVDVVYTLCKSDDMLFDISDEGLSETQVRAR